MKPFWDYIARGPLGPNSQLLRSCGPEGISGAHKHFFALALEFHRELSYGSSLADSVYAYNKYCRGLCIKFQPCLLYTSRCV